MGMRDGWGALPALTLATGMVAGTAVADDVSPMAASAARATGVVEARAADVVRAAERALADAKRTDLTERDLPVLVALAVRESHLRAEVERCEVTGDGGRAVGLWQEHAVGPRRERLCRGGVDAQAREAVRHLALCPSQSWAARIACYAGRKEDHPIVRARVELAERLARAAEPRK